VPSVGEGIIWISLSIVFGIPPVVSLTPSSLVPLLFAHDIAPQLFLILNLNGKFYSLQFTGDQKSTFLELSEAFNLVCHGSSFLQVEKPRRFLMRSAIQMFQVPAMTAVTISATRIYRSLTHFSSDAYGSLTLLSSTLLIHLMFLQCQELRLPE
jgi:hypothetical protein